MGLNMAAQVESLIVKLDAKVTDYIKNLDKASKQNKKTGDSLVVLNKKTKKVTESMFKFSSVAQGVFAALSVRVVTDFSDQIQIADNQLRNVTSSTEEYNAVSEELNRIAIETRQNVSGLTSVYARFTRAGKEAGFSQREVLDFTETLTKAFKIEGNTVAEVNSILLQLTQAFRSGRIAGEEFRALSEGSTLALQALAKQLNVTVGELKDMAAQGEVTPRALVDGMKGISAQVNAEAKKLAPTFAEIGTTFGNVLSTSFRQSGISGMIGSLLTEVQAGLTAVNETITGDNDLILTQYALIGTVGVESLSKIKVKAIEIAEINREIAELSLFDDGEGGAEIDFLIGKAQDLRESITALAIESKFYTDEQQEGIQGMIDKFIDLIDVSESARVSTTSSPLDVFVSGEEDPRIQAEKDFIEIVNELNEENVITIEERLIRDVELHKAALDQKLINEEQFNKAQADSVKKFAKDKAKLDDIEKKNSKQNAKLNEGHARQGMMLAALVFEDNKAISSGIALVNTATGITKALASQDYVGAALTAVIGAAQIASINSASRGGGAVSAVSGGTSGVSPAQQGELTGTSTLELSSQDEDSASVITVRFETDSGDALLDALAEGLNNNQRRGA